MKRKYLLPFFFTWISFSFILHPVTAIIQYNMNYSCSGSVATSYIELQNGTAGSVIYNTKNTSANITINYISGIHDHILNITDNSAYDLDIKLQILSVVNITNLNIIKLYLKNATGALIGQIEIDNKSIIQNEGNYFRINASENIPIVLEEDSFDSGISTQLEMKLIAKRPQNTIYYEFKIILDMT